MCIYPKKTIHVAYHLCRRSRDIVNIMHINVYNSSKKSKKLKSIQFYVRGRTGGSGGMKGKT